MNGINTDTTSISVTFFDDFKIAYKDKVLNEKKIRSDMVTKLLAYMICHRKNNISVQELSEALWENDECDNPANALKNLIYRSRMVLRKYLGEYSFIMTGRGYYFWNNDIKTDIDAEEFENLCSRALSEENIDKRIQLAQKAIRYYKDKFFSRYCDNYWVVTLNAYYHSLYLNIVKQLSYDLNQSESYVKMEKVCYKALCIDELDEDIHYYYIKALINENKRDMAEKHYKKLIGLLYDQLHVRPSERIIELYDTLLKDSHTIQSNTVKIKNELRDGVTDKGAFVCEYGVFKKSCELELRRSKRNKCDVYVVIFTLNNSIAGNKNIYRQCNITSDSIKRVMDIITVSVRSGDIVCRYSSLQFMVLLTSGSYKDIVKIADRVTDNINKLRINIRTQYSIEKINA